MSNPFFSILVTVYNTEKYLSRALDSCLLQSFKNIEIIVVNDCSTDSSAEILKEYEKNDSRITVITYEKNSGALLTRKTAMEKATGEYILFLDSDDYLELTACETLFNKLIISSCDILEFGYMHEPTGLKIYPDKRIENRFELLFDVQNPLSHTLWNKAYKKEIIKLVQEIKEPVYLNFFDDCYLAVLFNAFTKNFLTIDSILLHYSILEGLSNSKKFTEEQLLKNIHYLKTLKTCLSNFLLKNQQDKQYDLSIYLNRCYSYQYDRILQSDNSLFYKSQLVTILDNTFNTDYINKMQEYFEEIERKAKLYDNFVNSIFIKRLYLFLSYNYHAFIKVIKSRFFKKDIIC